MALMSVEELKKGILKMLKDVEMETIVLAGDAGMGKTWIAREIGNCAINEGICYETLWVSMNMKLDPRSLLENIAHQLSLLSTLEEWEDEDNVEEESLKNLKQRILTKLEEKRSAAEKGQCLLLILDDYGNKMNKDDILSMLPVNSQNTLKFLISRRNSDGGQITVKARTIIEDKNLVINVEPLPEAEQLNLLLEKVEKEVSGFPGFGEFSIKIAKKSMGLPAAITLIAGALNCVRRHDNGFGALKHAIEEAASYEKADDNATWLLHCAYDMFPSSVMVNCFWHSRQFFSKYGGVHYNELITHWLMEGYLGHIDHVEQAYEEGHRVLMELIDRGMLKIQEGNFVVVEGAMLNVTDSRCTGLGGTASLGLASVFDEQWKGLGRVTQTDGLIKTLRIGKKREKVSTVLIDGRRLSREVPEKYFQCIQELEVLGFFDPRLELLPSSLSEMNHLLVLLLRGCDLLKNISGVANLKTLTVLEISGAKFLETIPENLFHEMPHLRSLNLSALPIQSLPQSFSNLNELRWLILRQCVHLDHLPKLKTFTNLEVLDLSGATSFKRFVDKNFGSLQKLQMLDLSYTKVERLPIFLDSKISHGFKDLTRLLLSGCGNLSRLPSLKPLSGLQVLDLSGAGNVKEISEESFENKDDLKILDLSKTAVSQLPSNIANVSVLKLKGCSGLVKLPYTAALTHLELLDLSDAAFLDEIKDKSFDHLRFLHYLDLSNTKVKNLPSLSNASNLRQLLLRGCSSLEILPEMNGLLKLEVLDLSGCVKLVELPHLNAFQKLEVLDLSGCIRLTGKGNESFEPMSGLRKLNLDQCGTNSFSETTIKFLERLTHLEILKLSGVTQEFSSFSNLTNLLQLSLKGCSGLTTVQHLEFLSKLEILDLSGTAVTSLPCLDKLINLRELFLSGCSSLEELPPLNSLLHLEVLDLSGTGIKKFPYEISELTCLKYLCLPDLKAVQVVDWGRIKRLPGELNWDQCGFSEPAEHFIGGRKPAILVNDTKFFQFLKENSKLMEACLDRFFFCVSPPKEQGNNGNAFHHRDELIFSDVYFQTKHLSDHKEQGRSIEICRFNTFPSGIEHVIQHAEYLSLIENLFMTCLCDLGVGNLTKIKGCWLERCTKMRSIFDGETCLSLGENLEILWVSNLPDLNSFYIGNAQSFYLKNLKRLHLDCCPKLENVFPLPPLLEKLEILQIKFCDKLNTVFECDKSDKVVLGNLRKLYLLELPELTSVGATLPSLDIFVFRGCPKLRDSKASLRSMDTSLEIARTEIKMSCQPTSKVRNSLSWQPSGAE